MPGKPFKPKGPEQEWMAGLSNRSANCLLGGQYKSKEEVQAAYDDGSIDRVYNLGKKAKDEIAEVLGIKRKEPKKLDAEEWFARAKAEAERRGYCWADWANKDMDKSE